MMDTSGFSQVGRYGTISLLKRNEDDAVVTSFGIDTEELTFGRETTCGVRLYYPDVALLHCKVVFEERKAFLVVLGESGVFVDGCKVFPRTSNNLSTIIPLANNSEFEIHSKRFRYSYPPKEIRAVLFATPARPRNRGLRLSMIHSAQVFSPCPSKDPRENLKILQSPLKNSFKSPVKAALQEEEIILVQGSHPRVVQEDRDLVILEDVALEPPSPTKPHASSPELPHTPPRRKSLGGNALHRAVLIRSAQRAVIKAEKEREEEEEEMEVFGAVVGADDQDEYEDNREDIEMGSPSDKEEFLNDTEDSERNDQKPLWRKSLGKIMWPFGGSQENAQDSNEMDDGPTSEDEDNNVPTTPPSMNLYSTGADFRTHQEDEDKDETEIPTPLPSRPNLQYTPIRRTFGSFMTPQAKPLAHGNRAADVRPAIGRFSLGGGEAKRVVMRQPWKVSDIVIPPLDAAPSNSTRNPEEAAKASTIIPQTPNHLHAVMASTHTPMRTPARPTLTEGERKAIQERRRSALKETGSFFFSVAPGLTPAKSKSSSSSSSSVKESSGLYNSSMKGHIIHEENDEIKEDKQEQEDARCLLDRMKGTVDEMRRRRSVVLRVAPHTDPHPLLAPAATPQRPLFEPELHQMVDSMEDESNEVKEQEPFSLLRPGAREEVVSRLVPATREVESSVEGPIPLPIVVLDPIIEGGSESRDNPEIPEQPIRTKEGGSRLLRAPKPINVVPGSSENVEEEQKEAGSKPRSRSTGPATRRSRSRTPQPPVPEQQEESAKVVQTMKSTIGDSDVTASRRTRKATAEPEEQQPMTMPLPATGKRGRKAPVDATFEQPEQDIEKPKEKTMPVKRIEGEEQHLDQRAEGSSKVTTPAAAKRGRPRKVVQESLDEESIPPVPVIAKAGTRKKTTTPGRGKSSGTRKAVTANTAVQNDGDDDDEDEDPLDSYNAVEELDDDEVDPPGPPLPSGIKTKGRKKVTATVAVKQEVDDERSFSDLEEDALLATAKGITTRASSAKKGGRATPTTRTPAATDGGRQTRNRTPATAPASTTFSGSDKDKENAMSGDREDSEMQAQGVTVKVRVSRSRGATAGGEGTTGKMRTGSGTTTRSAGKAVKVEEAAVVVAPVRVRRTRATTKTG